MVNVCFPKQQTQLQHLTGELRSHVPQGNSAHVIQLRPDAVRNTDFLNLVAICIMLCFQMNFGNIGMSAIIYFYVEKTTLLFYHFSPLGIYTEYSVKNFFKNFR